MREQGRAADRAVTACGTLIGRATPISDTVRLRDFRYAPSLASSMSITAGWNGISNSMPRLYPLCRSMLTFSLTISVIPWSDNFERRPVTDYDLNNMVYSLIDEALAGGAVPPGAKGGLYRVIDELRLHRVDPHRAALAERISIQLHRLESALHVRDRAVGDRARDDLRQLAVEWIEERLCGSGRRKAKAASHPLSKIN